MPTIPTLLIAPSKSAYCSSPFHFTESNRIGSMCAMCYPVVLHMSQGRSTPCIGDKLIQPLMTGILIMGPYKPLPTLGLSFPSPIYMEMSWELMDPIKPAHIKSKHGSGSHQTGRGCWFFQKHGPHIFFGFPGCQVGFPGVIARALRARLGVFCCPFFSHEKNGPL